MCDVRQLKKNFALLELIERIQQSRSGGETVDRYARDRLLGIDCDEDPCHTAVLFCTVCESHLCERCADSSHDTNVLSKHRRIPLSQKPASTGNCRIHNSYPIEFVCKEETCSNRNGLMCTFCRDYGLHKGHAHVLIERETDELREKLQESISEVTKTLAKVETLKRRLQKAAAELSNRERGPFGDALTQLELKFSHNHAYVGVGIEPEKIMNHGDTYLAGNVLRHVSPLTTGETYLVLAAYHVARLVKQTVCTKSVDRDCPPLSVGIAASLVNPR
ncbi:hypothetical protein Y032_0042g705 [Ancylostoma ceylanicum]|uniref:B box-type domain-containing protein n=1 Tax=Ancylostoma ceylanicum TaxID=53326 RepID=A0A016UH09_9BILA|nr:hypothetical protein Y032_0042g705 [Ancylostoma ceylanicum]